jgi:hypothetical protein
MAFAHTVFTTHGFAPAHSKRKRGFFRSLLDAMILARQHEAEREIARYLDRSGDKFTDESEREIERLLMKRPNW